MSFMSLNEQNLTARLPSRVAISVFRSSAMRRRKLNPRQIAAIKRSHKSSAALARKYGVHSAVIRRARGSPAETVDDAALRVETWSRAQYRLMDERFCE